MAKVSFVVAVYNVAPYIERCVRSLYEQTLDDIEIVLVDDCSPDNSIEIAKTVLEEYPERRNQVKVLRFEHNTGLIEVRKRGLELSEGEYVINVDGDDYTEPLMAEIMYGKAKECDADMVVCNFYRDENGKSYFLRAVPDEEVNGGGNIKDDIINKRLTPCVWCKMMKRSLLSSNEMVWPVRGFYEDVVISTVATYYSKKIAWVEDPLYHYCYREKSFCGTETPEHRMKNQNDLKQNLEVVVRFLLSKGVYDKYREGIYNHMFYAKKQVLPFVSERKYRNLWFNTYPELNKILLFGDDVYKSSYREKVWMLAMTLGLYPRFKRLLESKYLLPNRRWRA